MQLRIIHGAIELKKLPDPSGKVKGLKPTARPWFDLMSPTPHLFATVYHLTKI